MPLELDVFIPQPDSEIESKLKSELAENGISMEYHPEFDMENQSGFLPLKVIFDSDNGAIQTAALKGKTLGSGFELDIEEFDSFEYLTFLEDEGEDITPEYNQLVSDCEFRLAFYCEPEEDPASFRLTYLAAACITKIYNGLLINPDTGAEVSKDVAISEALKAANEFESQVEDWVFPEFKGWD